jgi:hypothetical protein
MVKRRNSPLAGHDGPKSLGTRADFSPALLEPMPLSPRQKFAAFA